MNTRETKMERIHISISRWKIKICCLKNREICNCYSLNILYNFYKKVAIKRSKLIFDYNKNNGTEGMPIIQKSGIYNIHLKAVMIYIGKRGIMGWRLRDMRGGRMIGRLLRYMQDMSLKKKQIVNSVEKYDIIKTENKLRERNSTGILEG